MDDDKLTEEEQAALDESMADDGDETEEEEQQAAPAKEAADDDDGEEDGDAEPEKAEAEPKPEPEKKFVPLQALDAERGKRRDVEAELTALQAKFQAMQPAQPAQQDQPDEMPDAVLEPEKHREWWARERQRLTEPYERMRQQQEQQQRLANEFNQLKRYAETHEAAFREQYKDADYDGALKYMQDKQARIFKAMGYQPYEIQQKVSEAELSIAVEAARRGLSPAALVYNLAMESGFSPAGASGDASDDVSENITRLADVQRQTRSINGAAGGPKPDEFSVADLANMTEKQLDALERKDPEKFRRMIGASE